MKKKFYIFVESQEHERIETAIRRLRPEDQKEKEIGNPSHLHIYSHKSIQHLAMRLLLWHLSAAGTIDYDRNNRFIDETTEEVIVRKAWRSNGQTSFIRDIQLILLYTDYMNEKERGHFAFLLESLGYSELELKEV